MLYLLLWTLGVQDKNLVGWTTFEVRIPCRLCTIKIGIPTNTWCEATLYSLGAAGTRLSLGVPIGYLLLCLARHA